MKITKYYSSLSVLFFALVFLISGCSTEDTAIDPKKSWIDGEGTAEASDVSFNFKYTLFRSDTENYSFNASIKNKVIEGTFEVFNYDRNGISVSDAKGNITCIVFEEDCKTARITGIITSGSDPEFLGLYAVWTVVDDGLDLNETTDIRYPIDEATAKYHCEEGLTLDWFNMESMFSAGGKVKVESKDCN